MLLFLRRMLFLIVILNVTGCSSIAELGLLKKVSSDAEGVNQSLEINMYPDVVSQQMVVKEDGSLWSIDVGFLRGVNNIDKGVYLGREVSDLYGQVNDIEDVREVVAFGDTICALKNNGEVWTWGGLLGGWGLLQSFRL